MTRPFSRILAAAWLPTLALLAACGHKGPPLPPPQIIPARTVDLSVQQRGDEIRLSFTYPTTTLTGLPLGDLQAVEFWELVREVPLYGPPPVVVVPGEEDAEQAEEAQEGSADEAAQGGAEDPGEPVETAPSGPPPGWQPPDRLEDLFQVDPAEFSVAATIRLTLTGPELTSAILGDKIIARFPLGEAPTSDDLQAYTFAIKTLSYRGLASPISNPVELVRRETPTAPSEFEVIPGSSGVELRWWFAGRGPAVAEAPDGGDEVMSETLAAEREPEPEADTADQPEIAIDGFNIYRRGARERTYGPPLRRVAADARSVIDTSARLSESYIYAVVAIVESAPLVETAFSVEREVDYDDRFAPPPPTNLVTLVEAGSVRLLWDASKADDVAGYFILRRVGSGEFVQINDQPITELEYTDTRVTPGTVVRYKIEAIDQLGNRGSESPAVEARIP